MIDTKLMLEMIHMIMNSCERIYGSEKDPVKKKELAFCISEAEGLREIIESLYGFELTEEERKTIKTVKRYSLADAFWSERTLKTIDGILRKLPLRKS